MAISPNFWVGKRVWITGCTGFKGSWLSLWLTQLGAEVFGYALAPDTTPALWEVLDLAQTVNWVEGDVRDVAAVARALQKAQPDIVFHLAAQPLVRRSYAEPHLTFETNIMGTVSVLEACRQMPCVKAVVVVTTDKVYEDQPDHHYTETDPLGGHDPYSASKAAAEVVCASYGHSFFKTGSLALATARAGNVIGGGDWAEDRLIPDAIRAMQSGTALTIRYPQAIRPWQHVFCPLSGYLMLAEALFTQGQMWAGAWNFGPDAGDEVSVQRVLNQVQTLTSVLQWRIDETAVPHESPQLRLDWTKAKTRLGWEPAWSLKTALSATMDWYEAHAAGQNMRDFSVTQLEAFNP